MAMKIQVVSLNFMMFSLVQSGDRRPAHLGLANFAQSVREDRALRNCCSTRTA
jgi:hypothetical protein